MAPLPVIDGVVRVTFTYTNPGYSRAANNVMHFVNSAPVLDDLIDALDSAVTANCWAHTSTDTIISELALTPLDGIGNTRVATPPSPSIWKGTNGSGATVPQVCALLKNTTDSRGRSNNGRNFLPWPVEPVINAGVLDSTTRTNMQTAWTDFLSTMNTALYRPVIASYKNADFAFITKMTVESFTATQRRRQPRS